MIRYSNSFFNNWQFRFTLVNGRSYFNWINYCYFNRNTKKHAQISSDGAISIILTFLFSIAIIIISNYTRNVHIDTDAVFLGNVELINLKQIYKILPILIINLIFIFLFFKEIKIFIFDPCLCSLLGFSTIIINYLLMTLVSLTVVVCFDIVGSIMVIACMIGPAMTAILLTSTLWSGFYYLYG
uniref:Metal ABC transporter permease n=1 Tax=Candidatus Phytoplasma australasiaticum subsp. australasiaticum TaxID=2832407 RepID=A0A7S7FZQ7_9MOLU|nr:metal ABC transporter permease ['Parthenium hysterophorus' phyllody phytoplasma]